MRLKMICFLTILMVISCLAAPQQKLETTTVPINELIEKIFGTGNRPTTPGVEIEKAKPTRTPDRVNSADDNCECVHYYQCQNNTIINDGSNLIDIRFHGPCDDYLDVCCQKPNILPAAEKITPKPNVHARCGQRNPNGAGFRITGDKDGEAQFAEFPWMVAILKEEAIGKNEELLNVYQCGGSLIHPSVVLTAAHCISGKPASSLKIRAGEWDTQTKNEIYPHQDRQVAQYVIDESFNKNNLRNDFALLRLTEPVQLAENVNVVCLPEHNVNLDSLQKQRCFASGWGKDVFGKEGQYQVILKKIELPIVGHENCQRTLRNTRLGKYFNLHESFVCAGGEAGKDTCKGDGGSPLVCPIDVNSNIYYQTGIVAWGIGCGENQVPGVYANVAYARYWIDRQMASWGLDTRGYSY